MSFRRRFLRQKEHARGVRWSAGLMRRARRYRQEKEEGAMIAEAKKIARERIAAPKKNWLGRLGDSVRRRLPAARRVG